MWFWEGFVEGPPCEVLGGFVLSRGMMPCEKSSWHSLEVKRLQEGLIRVIRPPNWVIRSLT